MGKGQNQGVHGIKTRKTRLELKDTNVHDETSQRGIGRQTNQTNRATQ